MNNNYIPLNFNNIQAFSYAFSLTLGNILITNINLYQSERLANTQIINQRSFKINENTTDSNFYKNKGNKNNIFSNNSIMSQIKIGTDNNRDIEMKDETTKEGKTNRLINNNIES